MELEREKYIKQCSELQIEYNPEVLKSTVDSLNEKLTVFKNLERHYTNYKELLEVEKQIVKPEETLESLENEALEKSLEISELKKGLELLKCPKCEIGLRYANGKLEIGDRSPVSLELIRQAENEYQTIKQKIEKVKKYQELEQTRLILENSLIGINKTDLEKLNPDTGNKISNFLNIVRNIKWIEPFRIQSSELERQLEYNRLIAKRDSISKELDEIPENLDDRLEKISKALSEAEELYRLENLRVKENDEKMKLYNSLENARRKELERLESLKRQVEESKKGFKLEKEKIDKMKQMNSLEIENVKKEIQNKQEQLKELSVDESVFRNLENVKTSLLENRDRLEKGIYGLEQSLLGKKYEEKRKELVKQHQDVETLNRLKLKAINIECKQLEDTVNTINKVLETTLPIFFFDPISLKLLLYKKVKSGIKPGLNLEICYKGNRYDSINSLSGGEGDRISLALLLALNSVSNSPLIMLDECVSSLDVDLKESCIEAIKSIPNQTVIVVDHDDSLEGFYDNVLKV